MKIYTTTMNLSIKQISLFVLMLFTFMPSALKADHHIDYENAIILEGFINENLTLETGKTYLVKHNVRVSSNATLNIPGNAILVFFPHTSIVVEGGLNLNGTPNNFIHLKNHDKTFRGEGIVVRGSRGGNINIRYARFDGLDRPLVFEVNWYRQNVSVLNNIFQNIKSGESSVIIQMPSTIGTGNVMGKTDMNFSRNNFVNNWGSIYIENFQDDVLDLTFSNNLLSNNVVYGIDKGIPSNTPVFGLFDNEDKNYLTQFRNNSIFGNYQINAATDSIIREISFGIQGYGESFNIPNNYFRSKDNRYINSTFDHFYHNNNLPLLIADPFLTEPLPETHAHIYRVHWNGTEITDYTVLPAVTGLNVRFDVYFNRPVEKIGDYQMDFLSFDTISNEVNVKKVDITNTNWSEDKKRFTFTVQDPNFLRNPLGYVVLYNFEDNEGFEVPEFTIGQLQAINRYSRLYREGFTPQFASTADVVSGRSDFDPSPEQKKALESLAQVGDLSYLNPYVSLARTFEIGGFVGASNYSGELTSTNIDQNEFNLAYGLFVKYNISKWFSTHISFRYGKISGQDFNEIDPNRKRRALHFRSEIWELAAIFEWHLLQYGVNRGERFSPALFVGVAGFQFNPQARAYLGLNDQTGEHEFTSEWYDLHPIGTEGQNVPGSGKEHYKLRQLSIPFGISLDFIIEKSVIISAEVGMRFTFTDYLDDIAGAFYITPGNDPFAEIKANAPDYGTVIVNRGTINEKEMNVIDILIDPSLVRNPEKPYYTTFNNFRRGSVNRDWYMFAGIKVSKVLGMQRKLERAEQRRLEQLEF